MAEPTQESPPSNIHVNPLQAAGGMNLSSLPSQVKPGQVSYALNAIVENWDGKNLAYQNEYANELVCTLPEGYQVLGKKAIIEQDLIILFLANPATQDSEIGQISGGVYQTLINDPQLNFSVAYPIYKVFYRIINCATELYWTDNFNPRRFLNLSALPFETIPDPTGCGTVRTGAWDVNKLLVQPRFSIPKLSLTAVTQDSELTAGTYQFCAQYANKAGEGYTSFYSVTSPLPLFDPLKVTLDFNYPVGAAIHIQVSEIDTTGEFEYLNLAVVKTINNIASFELVGSYVIEKDTLSLIYTGQKLQDLSSGDIFEKFPIYDKAQDGYSVQGILGWVGLTETERISYQQIASGIEVGWASYRLKKGAYKDPLHAALHRGYMRDEVYALEFVPLLQNGKQCDGFTIPGRLARREDLEAVSTGVPPPLDTCTPSVEALPRWQVENTATLQGFAPEYLQNQNSCYEGIYQVGEMAYWESGETYPCNETLWGSLAGRPIRHHKTPDTLLAPTQDSQDETYLYALALHIDTEQIWGLIQQSSLTDEQKSLIQGYKIVRGNRVGNKSVVAKGIFHNVGKYSKDDTLYYFPNYMFNDVREDPYLQDVSFDEDSHSRFCFHSPDTHFYQPTLGSSLKVEGILRGEAEGHIVQVRKHARYKLFSDDLYLTALSIAGAVGLLSRQVGLSDTILDGTAIMDAYRTMVDIFERTTPRINYGYQINQVGRYHKMEVPTLGTMHRTLDIAAYASPGMISVGDTHTLNNYQRESSVYLRTTQPLPLLKGDESKFLTVSTGVQHNPIASYYGAIRSDNPSQWGQIYSYETVDTGFQWSVREPRGKTLVFGGDIFISGFAYKSKLPLFIDNGVGLVDETDLFYDEWGNVGRPRYWYTANIKGTGRTDQGVWHKIEGTLFGTRNHQLFNDQLSVFYRTGKMFLFAYGIPYFYCESEVNCDMRQAFNAQEGDFFPRVSSSIPDEWLQEITTSIAQDNTYYYNKTYSKQNKENYFSHLPPDYLVDCSRQLPYRTIYSDSNDWRVYRPLSYHDFPREYGPLTSVDGIENKMVLVRFHNRTQLYNALLTLNTSTPQAAFLGNGELFKAAPPYDFATSDSGHFGSQHKCFIQTPYGYVFTDAVRGDVVLVAKNRYGMYMPQEISSPEVGKFFTQHLPVAADNHFNQLGIHGIYDPLADRILLTKLDGRESFTISFNFQTQSWVSFHSYLPESYVEHPSLFYSIHNGGVWLHGADHTRYNEFYGVQAPYVLEYTDAFKYQDEILQSIKDYSLVLQYAEDGSYYTTDDYFNKCVLFNHAQCSGVLELAAKPKASLKAQLTYPIYAADSKTILYAKSDSFYQFNQFWALNRAGAPIWKPSTQSLSQLRELNQDAMDYGKRARIKAPLRGKALSIRLILDNRTDLKIISQLMTTDTQISYK